jgi:hypothetical protein
MCSKQRRRNGIGIMVCGIGGFSSVFSFKTRCHSWVAPPLGYGLPYPTIFKILGVRTIRIGC